MKFQNFSFSQNCKYAYGLCLRLAPFYAQFSSEYEFGDNFAINACLQAFFENLDNELALQSISEKYIPLIDLLVPDMDDFNSELLPSLGLDAITSILTLLDYTIKKSADVISDINEISFNSADFIAKSMNEFAKIKPGFNKDPLISEQDFTASLLKLVSTEPDKETYQKELKILASKYCY